MLCRRLLSSVDLWRCMLCSKLPSSAMSSIARPPALTGRSARVANELNNMESLGNRCGSSRKKVRRANSTHLRADGIDERLLIRIFLAHLDLAGWTTRLRSAKEPKHSSNRTLKEALWASRAHFSAAAKLSGMAPDQFVAMRNSR